MKIIQFLNYMRSLDVDLFLLINTINWGENWLTPTMQLLSSNWFWIVIGFIGLAVASLKRSVPLTSLLFLTALNIGVSDLVSYRIFKPFFARERPCFEPTLSQQVILRQSSCGSLYGLPSNHAANAMAAVATVMMKTNAPVVKAAAFILAVLVGGSRIYLGVHYPVDVLLGYVIGGFLAFYLNYLFLSFKPLFKRQKA